MTNHIFSFIVCFVLLAGCSKKEAPILEDADSNDPTTTIPVRHPIIDLGKGSALKDGQLWNLEYEATYYKSDTVLRIKGHKYIGNILESFLVIDVPYRIGIYPIEYYSLAKLRNQIPNVAVGYLVDGDQGAGSFFIDTTRQDHFFEVIYVDKAAKTVEGRFQMYLRRHPVGINALSLPDSMAITGGRFHLEVKEP